MSMMIISAFGEILVGAIRDDGARPPLSSTHSGLQRQCGVRERKRSSDRLQPAEPSADSRLGL